MKLYVEMPRVVNLRKEVKKVKEVAKQDKVLSNKLRATLVNFWQQANDLSIVNLTLKEEAKKKDKETRALLAAAAQQATATRKAAKVLATKLAKELTWTQVEIAQLA